MLYVHRPSNALVEHYMLALLYIPRVQKTKRLSYCALTWALQQKATKAKVAQISHNELTERRSAVPWTDQGVAGPPPAQNPENPAGPRGAGCAPSKTPACIRGRARPHRAQAVPHRTRRRHLSVTVHRVVDDTLRVCYSCETAEE